MKQQEVKTDFVEMRAQGNSYSKIAATLHISKATCTAWEREFKIQISDLKQERLNELYNNYYMTKEARIKRLGDTLNKINDTLCNADLTKLQPEKLLDFKLKYLEALKEEYSDTSSSYQFSEDIQPKEILTALGNLLSRIQAGELNSYQVSKESLVMINLLKAYDTVEIKTKLDALEAIIGR